MRTPSQRKARPACLPACLPVTSANFFGKRGESGEGVSLNTHLASRKGGSEPNERTKDKPDSRF